MIGVVYRENMVDADGFRPNVGIVVAANDGSGRVLWARRVGGHDAWQFPQGGLHDGESPEDAVFRELYEEVGLGDHDVRVLARTKGWLRYRLPKRLRRNNSTPGFVGQKQKWFLLELTSSPDNIRFDRGRKAEFDGWRWVSFWYPVTRVVDFKREVYRRALTELAPALPLDEALRANSVQRVNHGASSGTHNESRGSTPGNRRRRRRRRGKTGVANNGVNERAEHG